MIRSTNTSDAVRLIPLGGLGEIGMNCLAIETNEAILVLDAGITFPKVDLGIDVFYPDFTYLTLRKDRVAGVVITHGHEDHIGALPFLLKRLYVPVHGPCHAIGLASERLREHDFDPRQLPLHTYTSGQPFDIGPFHIEPIYVTHSIADAHALSIRVNGKHIVHTGDFKFDEHSPDGHLSDTNRLKQLGDEGVDLLLSDSTNIHKSGTSGSEQTVRETLDEMIGSAKQRVVIGMFSSNIHRMRTVEQLARKHGRKLCLLGRSVHNQLRVASSCGHLDWASDTLVPSDMASSVPPEQLLVIATGTQAETMAALSRMSVRKHPALALDPGDLLILSSRIIPGNDPAVLNMIGNFIRQDVTVHSRQTHPTVHVSGHGHREEQRKMIELLRPKAFMPVHGTLFHLQHHEQFAKQLGVTNTILAENGDVITFEDGTLRRTGVTEVAKIAVYGRETIPDEVINQRSTLARRGVAVITLEVDDEGKLQGQPILSTKGILRADEEEELHGVVIDDIRSSLLRFVEDHPTTEQIQAVAEQALRRSLDGISGRRPVAIAQVVRV